MEKRFQLTQKGTNVPTEVRAGLTTFMAMSYILAVNPGMFAELEGILRRGLHRHCGTCCDRHGDHGPFGEPASDLGSRYGP